MDDNDLYKKETVVIGDVLVPKKEHAKKFKKGMFYTVKQSDIDARNPTIGEYWRKKPIKKHNMKPGKNVGANIKHIASNVNYDGIQFNGITKITRGFGKWAIANYVSYFIRAKITNEMRIVGRFRTLNSLNLRLIYQISPQTKENIKIQITNGKYSK